MYLGHGWLALSYIAASIVLLAAPFAASGTGFHVGDPTSTVFFVELVLRIGGSIHLWRLARRGDAFTQKWFSRWYALLLLNYGLPLVLALVLRTGLQTFNAPTASMKPTLQVGDHFLVNRLAYRFGSPPGRNDVVVFTAETQGRRTDYVKRVVGVPGDTIRVEGTTLRINQDIVVPLDAASAESSTKDRILGDRMYFMVGDNYLNSLDSRNFLGDVNLDSIKGHVVAVFWNSETREIGWRRVR